ncbi:hypothetical protein BDBG_03926 [Blastomyces gilchristii SLH14081]|uniref:Uncharacterized protein n=1 Tax=Blastomyces gilchristii (strain SLH14081) TaxID=559298 RepID=A0A179ULM8_BLAGS|nr:uncharacterized protein BDBG_03926 [Blastomyces gilchristii SLH14081]OAT07911.1 hypothetical protein BDBG_03926 [Blastomyces gilchristii SLH14081]
MKLLALTLTLFGTSMLAPVVMGAAVDTGPGLNAGPNAPSSAPPNAPPNALPDEDGPHPPRRDWCAPGLVCYTDWDCRRDQDCSRRVSDFSQIFCGTFFYPHSCWYRKG